MSTLKTLVNPYSSIGDLHSQGLDYIAQNLLSFEKLPNKPDIFITLSTTFVSKTNDFGNIPYNDIEVATTYALNYSILDIYPKEFTEKQIFYAKQAETVFDGYESLFDHIDEINAKIDDQVRIVLLSELTEKEQAPILCGLAVAKSSLYYWNQQFVNPRSYWSQINDKQAEQGANLRINWPRIDWGAVGKADLKGAVKGLIKGLFTGGNVVAGAVGGAIEASAGNLAGQIYDYYFG